MLGHFGFSYIGLLFLLLLAVPNLLWTRRLPAGYSTQEENKILLVLERTGQVCVTCTALAFSDFNWRGWSAWCLWLFAAILLMLLYACFWIRYFTSKRTLLQQLPGRADGGRDAACRRLFAAGDLWAGDLDGAFCRGAGHWAYRYPLAAPPGACRIEFWGFITEKPGCGSTTARFFQNKANLLFFIFRRFIRQFLHRELFNALAVHILHREAQACAVNRLAFGGDAAEQL